MNSTQTAINTKLVNQDPVYPEKTLDLQYAGGTSTMEVLVQPEEANITIAVLTDTRQSGTNRLVHLIAALLKREGYTNVHDNSTQSPDFLANENEDLNHKQLRVSINVQAGTMSQVPELKIDLKATPPNVAKALDGVVLDLQ